MVMLVLVGLMMVAVFVEWSNPRLILLGFMMTPYWAMVMVMPVLKIQHNIEWRLSTVNVQ